MFDAAFESGIAPRPRAIVNPYGSIWGAPAIDALGCIELNLTQRNSNLRMEIAGNVNLAICGQGFGAAMFERGTVGDHSTAFLVANLPGGLVKKAPFASITWSRFNGSVALPRNTLSLCDGARRRGLAPLNQPDSKLVAFFGQDAMGGRSDFGFPYFLVRPWT